MVFVAGVFFVSFLRRSVCVPAKFPEMNGETDEFIMGKDLCAHTHTHTRTTNCTDSDSQTTTSKIIKFSAGD